MHHLRLLHRRLRRRDVEARQAARADLRYDAPRLQHTHAAKAEAAGGAVATAHQKSVGISHIVRPRTILYFALWCLVGVVMLVSVVTRDRLDINVIPDRNPLT